MSLAFKQIKVYTKVTLLVVLALAIATVLFQNRGNTVRVWFFGLTDDARAINVIWLIVCTAVGSVVSWWVIVRALTLVGDARQIVAQKEKEKAERAQREMARKLEEQEKRIDEKLKRSISQGVETHEA